MKTGAAPSRQTGVEDKPDAELHRLEKTLAQEIPASQGILARVRKEIKRRKRHA